MWMDLNDVLYSPLPASTKKLMGGQNDEVAEYDIVNFLRSVKTNEGDIDNFKNRPFSMVSNPKKHCKPRQKKTLLSLKERQNLGLYKLRRKDMNYVEFLPLHNLWREYFSDYMDFETLKEKGFTGKPEDRHWENVSRMLIKADYHGAILTVKKSLCYSLVGKKGILIFDTKNTFQLLGEDNILRIVPKKSSVFTLRIHNFTFTILGNQFCIKPAARNSKKMKMLVDPEL